MKFSNATKLMCLFLSMVLIMGLMIGCQQSQSMGSTTVSPTGATNPSGSETQSPATDSPIATFGFPPDWIPPEWIELWGNGWAASPDDTYYAVDLQWAINRIHLPDAWDISTGSNTIRVGVIDSGVDPTHPDLQNRVNTLLSECFVPGFSALEDPLGHGTHVAGIIGAQGNNGVGVSGVCWNVEIVSLRVSGNDNVPQLSAVVDAIKSANNKGIHIINLSLTLAGLSAAAYTDLYNAIADFDGLVICAAGNSSVLNDPFANNDAYALYPCNIPLGNVVSVGASTNADTIWDYSHYGATTVDIFAPGNSILNCYPSDLCVDGACYSFTHNANGYHLMSGTSMAAPHVAGVAALLLSIHPELTAAELKQIIMDNVDIIYDENLDSVFEDYCVSGGRLNAYKALSDPSIHNFGLYVKADSTYHKRTCTTCGYAEYGMHKDSAHPGTGKCLICGYSGSSTMSGGSEDILSSILPATPNMQQCA